MVTVARLLDVSFTRTRGRSFSLDQLASTMTVLVSCCQEPHHDYKPTFLVSQLVIRSDTGMLGYHDSNRTNVKRRPHSVSKFAITVTISRPAGHLASLAEGRNFATKNIVGASGFLTSYLVISLVCHHKLYEQ